MTNERKGDRGVERKREFIAHTHAQRRIILHGFSFYYIDLYTNQPLSVAACMVFSLRAIGVNSNNLPKYQLSVIHHFALLI